MSTSSSIPVLSDVLFYTPNDPYNFQADNRPIYNLDSNIRHINTSLPGVGYGEHASVTGALLSPGQAVELMTTGLVRYPVAATAQASLAGSVPVLGIVIGATGAGLNRVIWASEHLDLSSVGLASLLANPAQGLLLVADCSAGSGTILAVASPSATQVPLGVVKTYPYVTVSSFQSATTTSDVVSYTAEANHHNLYGFTRLRNLLLAIDLGQAPVQYTKKTFYQSDLPSIGPTNTLNALLSADLATISASGATPTYDNTLTSKVVKESYTTFSNLSLGNDLISSTTGITYSWSNATYNSQLVGSGTNTYENYELSSLETSAGTTPDFSLAGNISLFETFQVDKYYQYAQVSYTNPIAYGKLTCTATVYNPTNTPNQGGESQQIIIWNFYTYDASSGLERSKQRIVTSGALAWTLFSDPAIFPTTLVNLQ